MPTAATMRQIRLQIDTTSVAATLAGFTGSSTITAIRWIAGYVDTHTVARYFIGRSAAAGSLKTALRFSTGVAAFAAVLYILV